MQAKSTLIHQEPFNYAIYLYEMNADEVFDHEGYVTLDSSLGLVEEEHEDPNA